MTSTIKIALGLSIAAAAAAIATPAAAIDFACREASLPAERTICSDARLARLDDTMARTYGRLWSVSNTRARISLRDQQHRFLNARNDCRWNARCIHDAYLDQISVLDNKLVAAMER
jgi:uncharacterized protein